MTLTFLQEGQAGVIASVGVAGSTQSERCSGAGGNKNYDDAKRSATQMVRALGEEKGWPKLTTLFQEAHAYAGWEFSSIAATQVENLGSALAPEDDFPCQRSRRMLRAGRALEDGGT